MKGGAAMYPLKDAPEVRYIAMGKVYPTHPTSDSLFVRRRLSCVTILLLLIIATWVIMFTKALYSKGKLHSGATEETITTLFNGDRYRRPYIQQFLQFAIDYNRNYENSNDAARRFEIFVDNMKYIERYQRSQTNAEFGLTEFADWSEDELALIIPKVVQEDEYSLWPAGGAPTPVGNQTQRAASFDWRTKKVVTHVKSQGNCGSCWAFATVGVVESMYAIANGSLVAMSEQQLIDCDQSAHGCNGGYRPYALQFVRDNGLVNENDYPYKAKEQEKCLAEKGKYFVKNVKYLPQDEESIADYVYFHGPVNVGINVTKGFLHYVSGVFSPSKEECEQQSQGSHAFVIVGYGRLNGEDCWLFKNSWGIRWGMSGFGYIKRGVNACGIARFPYSAIV